MDFDATAMEELARRLGLKDFDLLLLADGSGMRHNTPCGFHCTAYYRPGRQMVTHFGGFSAGSNNLAELAPFLHMLQTFHVGRWKKYEKELKLMPDVLVELVSDSELTVRCGNRVYARNAYGPLWAAVDWFEAHGYRLHWNHVPRNSNPFNERADALAGKVRRLLDEHAKAAVG